MVLPLTTLAQSSANSISFQGALNGPTGQPLPNGNYNLAFRFWAGPAPGGVAVSTNILVANVPVAGGVASTALPVDPAWFNGQTRYLGVSVGGASELLPRVLVTAVPYAVATRGIAVNPPVVSPPIQYLRPTNRVVIGTTTEDISRIPAVDQAAPVNAVLADQVVVVVETAGLAEDVKLDTNRC